MRSLTGDPIASAINAFGSMSQILGEIEDRPRRRELQAAQLEREKLGTEKMRGDIAFEEEQRKRDKEMWGVDNAMSEENKRHFQAVMGDSDKQSGNVKFSDKEGEALIQAGVNMPHVDLSKLDQQTEAATNLKQGMQALGQEIQKSPEQKIMITRDQIPKIIDSFEEFYADDINKGTNEHGATVEKDGVKKRIKSIMIDKSTDPPTISFKLEVRTPVKEGQVLVKEVGGDPKFTVNANAPGILEKGNIDLSKRPVVQRANGAISTIESMGIEEDGKEVVIPMISDDGKILTRDEAIKQYKDTGKHLGKFATEQQASAYAEELHSDPMWKPYIDKYSAKGQTETTYDAPMTFDHAGGNPQSKVLQLPIPLLYAQVDETTKYLNTMQVLMSQRHPEEMYKKIETEQQNKAFNKSAGIAMKEANEGKDANEKRAIFIQKMEDTGFDSEKIRKYANEFIKESEGMQSPQGKVIADRRRLTQESDVTKFDELTKEKEDGTNKTIYGPDGATKEVFIPKGKDYEPPKGWSLTAKADELQSPQGKIIQDRRKLTKPEERAEFDKLNEDKSGNVNKTIYGPDGKTKEVSIKKNEDYTPPDGWSLTPHEKDKLESPQGKIISDRRKLTAADDIKKFDELSEKKDESNVHKTVYGPNGEEKEIYIPKGKDYTLPQGWSFSAPEKEQSQAGKAVKDRRKLQNKEELDMFDKLIEKSEKKQYLSRSRQVGGMEVFEESHDEGKTWKEVSRGPKFAKQIAGASGEKKVPISKVNSDMKTIDSQIRAHMSYANKDELDNASSDVQDIRAEVKERLENGEKPSAIWSSVKGKIDKAKQEESDEKERKKAAKKAREGEFSILHPSTWFGGGNKPRELSQQPEKPKAEAPKSKAMDTMPPASEHKDKIIKDTTTGKRYKSNGKKWIEVK